jgi:predicted transcriptional regulator of viral defense system
MKKDAQNRIFDRIRHREKNWVFSAKDFARDFDRWEIDHSLRFLEKEGKIKRIIQGLYYCPEYSELLQRLVAPDIQRVAKALARKHGWKIFPEGNTALNYLGLSTQIPAKYIFISSGRSRKYTIENTTIEFRHRVLTESTIINENANLVVQAIKSLGKVHANKEFAELLAKRFSYDEWNKIEKAAARVAGWILDEIKKAKECAKNG